MSHLGYHYIAEFWECPTDILNDVSRLEILAREAAESARVTVLKSQFHQFSPQGVTGLLLLSESHLSMHTWPEHGYCAMDFFTCGDGIAARESVLELASRFGARRLELQTIIRGHLDVAHKMDVDHRVLYPPFLSQTDPPRRTSLLKSGGEKLSPPDNPHRGLIGL